MTEHEDIQARQKATQFQILQLLQTKIIIADYLVKQRRFIVDENIKELLASIFISLQKTSSKEIHIVDDYLTHLSAAKRSLPEGAIEFRAPQYFFRGSRVTRHDPYQAHDNVQDALARQYAALAKGRLDKSKTPPQLNTSTDQLAQFLNAVVDENNALVDIGLVDYHTAKARRDVFAQLNKIAPMKIQIPTVPEEPWEFEPVRSTQAQPEEPEEQWYDLETYLKITPPEHMKQLSDFAVRNRRQKITFNPNTELSPDDLGRLMGNIAWYFSPRGKGIIERVRGGDEAIYRQLHHTKHAGFQIKRINKIEVGPVSQSSCEFYYSIELEGTEERIRYVPFGCYDYVLGKPSFSPNSTTVTPDFCKKAFLRAVQQWKQRIGQET